MQQTGVGFAPGHMSATLSENMRKVIIMMKFTGVKLAHAVTQEHADKSILTENQRNLLSHLTPEQKEFALNNPLIAEMSDDERMNYARAG